MQGETLKCDTYFENVCSMCLSVMVQLLVARWGSDIS